jgi:hypothetical protein
MRFEVSYRSGTTHEVTLAGSLVVLGRDPGCDIVLNDTKCSRRHAVIEDTPEGLVIRDSGSANGVYVNERRVDRSLVKTGDTIRLGDVRLRMLAEIGETLIVAPDDVQLPASALPIASPPPAPSPIVHELAQPQWPETADTAPRESACARESVHPSEGIRPSEGVRYSARGGPEAARPLTVDILSGLWAILGPSASGAIALTAWRLGAGAIEWAVAAALCMLLVAGGLAMALGLRALAPWARHLQIASSYLGLVVFPFTPAAATALLYMSRSDVRHAFQPGMARGGAGSAEPTFALSIVTMVLVGVVFTGIAAFVMWPVR